MDLPVTLPCAPERILCILRQPGPLPLVTAMIRAMSDEPGARLITSPCRQWLILARPDNNSYTPPGTDGL